jgi:hypothetical protein
MNRQKIIVTVLILIDGYILLKLLSIIYIINLLMEK